MKKKKKSPPPQASRIKLTHLFFCVAAVAIGAVVWTQSRPATTAAEPDYIAKPPGTVTFNRDIAAIVHRECSGCHRPGESGPFDLITFADVKKRASQIAKVTRDRYMPPWLPERGAHPFAEERRLSNEELGLIQQWIVDGTPEGDPQDLPPLPTWTEGWQLGSPDLIVTLPDAYTLPGDGKDVYRNFVVPVPLTSNRFVRAVEFRAGSKAIHHTFIRLDRSGQSRKLDAQDSTPGFGGMDVPPGTESAGGHFLSWQPGRGPTRMQDGLSWPLYAGSELVLQVHMQATGKPETIRPTIGLYFTDKAPTNTPFKVSLSSFAIDIPAGKSDYVLQDTYELPVDVELLAVLPHAHYLARRMEGFAVLPDGTTNQLLLIKDWDFNWQSDFRYEKPISLPKGTRVAMRYTFDNSTNNIRNPNQPPRRVKYGLQSTDEMGELWLQVLARNQQELITLEDHYAIRAVNDIVTFNRFLISQDVRNAKAHLQLGKAYMFQGKRREGASHLLTAVKIQPDLDEGFYHLGLIAMDQQNFPEAESAFEQTLKLNPENFKARNNLGLICLNQNRLTEAEAHFNEVLRLNPGDKIALGNLRAVANAKAGRR